MKESKYIIRKIIIGVGIALCLMFLKSCNVNASVVLDGTTLTDNNFKVLNVGNRVINFNGEGVYPDFTTYPQYFLLTMCADNENITSWYINNNTLKNVNIYNTSYKCMFPNSTYTGGHIVYIYGTYDFGTNCSASLTNCLHNGSITFYVPNQSSWALLNYQNSIEEINIDYASNTIITQNQDIINQNKEIIQQNQNIYNMQKNESDETQQKLDDVNKNITDETSPNLNGLENSAGWLKPGPVDSILNLPLSLLNNLTTNLNKTCTPVDLPLPYLNKSLQLPCISTIYNQINGLNVFFNSIGVIASAFIIYEYLRKLYMRIDKILNFENSSDWGGI